MQQGKVVIMMCCLVPAVVSLLLPIRLCVHSHVWPHAVAGAAVAAAGGSATAASGYWGQQHIMLPGTTAIAINRVPAPSVYMQQASPENSRLVLADA